MITNHNTDLACSRTREFASSKSIQILCGALLLTFAFQGEGYAQVKNSNQIICRSWVAMKQEHVVMQSFDYSCGAATMATLLTYYWNDATGEQDILIDLGNLLTHEELMERQENGLALTDLKRIALNRGYRAEIGKLDSVHNLYELKVPVIVAISPNNYNHFVVLRRVCGDKVFLADPIRGNISYTVSEFSKIWIANTLLVVLDKELDQSKFSRLNIPLRELDPQRSNREFMRRRFDPTSP
ncbi:C39 family peptidase [Planctomicrobium sp. SH527]|uniref:C39 family peptidase n=1 Tax=Planctomicrobium sp. SH527 TaxID=3448123 RepID=UPI003F5BFA08